MKHLVHWLHSYSFSIVCVLICLFILSFVKYTWHNDCTFALIRFSAVYIFIWIWEKNCLKNSSHTSYIDKVTPQYEFWYVFKIMSLQETVRTMVALMTILPCVNLHMKFERSIVWKTLLTLAALIRLLPSMSSHMSFKITFL